MFKYIIRRILLAIPTIFITISLIFFGLRILPGDPAVQILGPEASEQALNALREQMGLNLPLWQQYLMFLKDTVQGDFGVSAMSGKSVTGQLLTNFPNTLELAIFSIIIGCVIGIPLGILAARKQSTKIDSSIRLVSLIGISAPPFLFGIIMIIIFSLRIPIFPSMGLGEGFWGSIYHLLLPSLTIGLILAAVMMRFTRASMLDEINREYIRTARAKGLPEKMVIYKHVLRNSLIPVVTVIGLYITSLISGAVLIETIFSRPGLGTLAIDAISSRDFPILQGCLILFTLVVQFVNILVDISYSFINPKIRPE
ncbi:ABC transporter permease [Alkalihalobacterium elongatum]|uniref:ABC transporter permease n=1 Tax=Alkalihalobacterium elongatum TaxID=2675466 RepID=UPI001C1F9C4B|nr:ABC transporter permease [Alkalihalobacterium elongatum]